MYSKWDVEDYSEWRREQIEEAANLGRCISYPDFAAWQRIPEIYAEANRARSFHGEGTTLSGVNRVLHTAFGHLTTVLAWLGI
jgi:hypothetical protein